MLQPHRWGFTLFVAVLLSLVVTMGAMAAEQITLEYWIPGTQQFRYETHVKAVEGFEALYPHIKVEFVQVPGDFLDKLQVAAATGSGPDVATVFGVANVIGLAEVGVVQALDPYLEKVPEFNEEDILPNFLDAMRYNGKLWALPLAAQPTALVWGKAAFDRVGLAPIEGTINEQELMEYHKRLTSLTPSGAIDKMGFVPSMWGGFTNWIYHWGGHLYDETTGEITLDHPANVAALEWMVDLYDTVGGIDVVREWQGKFTGSGTPAMYSGDQGMAIWSHYHFWFSGDYGDGYEYGYAPPPQMGDPSWQPKGLVTHTDARVLVTGSEHPVEAAMLLNWVTQGQGFQDVYTSLTGHPSTSISLNRQAYEEDLLPEWYPDGLWLQHYEVLQKARPWPAIPTLAEVTSAGNQAMNRAVNGEMPPRSALEEADRVMQALLDEKRQAR